jgi:NAD(P)-dependent dehydrogenase (short-subunit alcohol dehydrogenase family)
VSDLPAVAQVADRPRLDGKVAIVTGGGSRGPGFGTGRAAAVMFALHAARVLVVDRDLQAAEHTVKLITEHGGTAVAHEADVTSEADCGAMVGRALSLWGRLDILDNNVGVSEVGSVLDMNWDSWDRLMAVNVKSVALASAAAIPSMTSRGGGSIITLASISALRPRGLTAYTTAKGAVIALTRALAIDHGRSGIRANCLVPGPLYTPMAVADGMTDESRERRRRSSILQIEGTGWDIAHAAVFLASDEARYITGAVLPVDGGVSLRSPDR